MEPIDSALPIEPIDRTEPVDPMDRIDPVERIDRIDSSDRHDQRDVLGRVVGGTGGWLLIAPSWQGIRSVRRPQAPR